MYDKHLDSFIRVAETGSISAAAASLFISRAALNQLNLLAIHDETVDKWLNFSMIERDIIVVEATAEVARQIAQPGGDMLLSP